jgi:hypothetical protein
MATEGLCRCPRIRRGSWRVPRLSRRVPTLSTSHYTADLTDSISLSDGLVRVGTFTRTAAESPVLADSVTRQGTAARAVTDSTAISDTVSRQRGYPDQVVWAVPQPGPVPRITVNLNVNKVTIGLGQPYVHVVAS